VFPIILAKLVQAPLIIVCLVLQVLIEYLVLIVAVSLDISTKGLAQDVLS
jgi:hypothetical protein